MSLEDRDWYREEHARRNGHKAVHEWGRKKPVEGQTLNDFLKTEREKLRGCAPTQRPKPKPPKLSLTAHALIWLFLVAAFSIATVLLR